MKQNLLAAEPPAPVKLDWNYDETHGCEIAFLRGYLIKAEQDGDPENPFTDQDGYWPTIAHYDGKSTEYDKAPGPSVPNVLERFNDAQLVHDQKAIAAAIDTDPNTYLECDQEERGWHTDADFLRQAFEQALDDTANRRDKWDAIMQLYALLGIPGLHTESRGYCQGDWADLLIVATPEAQKQNGCTIESRRKQALDELLRLDVKTDATEDVIGAQAQLLWDKDLEAQADLYGAWAWGDVYGYVIEKPVYDEDGEIEEWVDACDHNSCWGYYGADHAKSGLEEAAIASVPDEPVRLPDRIADDEEDA